MLLYLELNILKIDQPGLLPLPPELPVYVLRHGDVFCLCLKLRIFFFFVLTLKRLLVPEAGIQEGKPRPQSLPLWCESQA